MKTIFPSNVRFLLLFACFLGISQPSFAQLVKFGLRAGITGSNLYDDANAKDLNTRIGFIGGSFMKIGIGNRIAIRPELLFAMKGSNFNYQTYQNTKLKLGYIELPVSLELRILKIINLHAGVHADYLVNADVSVQNPNPNPKITFTKEDLNLLDYGWHVGTGLELGPIGIHLRVSRGLKEVGKTSSVSNVVGNLKNATWSLTVAASL
ncbi:MAG: porin family protein [Bacteroidota bacterium]